MRDLVRRVLRDLGERRHVDAYAVAAMAAVLAVLSLVGDFDSSRLRWSVALAALSLLVFRITLPEEGGPRVDDLLHGRAAFADVAFGSRLRSARVVWVLAPSAVNLLTAATADELRRTVLARPDGVVRIAVLDPSADAAVGLAARQLDDADEHPLQNLRDALRTTTTRLRSMAAWSVAGTFEYRFVPYNPGFSIVAIDPAARGGTLILELHGFRNESIGNRMHLELRRGMSERWYEYWVEQFEQAWAEARRPDPPPA